MAKLGKNVEVKIGEDGKIILREPSNAEWNVFQKNRYPIGKGNRPKDNGAEARIELFDKIVIGIENIEDEEGPLTVETAKERLPIRIKTEVIFGAFENTDTIEIKN